MARPGQKRKRLSGRPGQPVLPLGTGHAANGSHHGADDEHDGAEDDDDGDAPQTKAGQVLPIADLPEDFTGEPSDGATYLALSIRANASLPFSKRVPVPAHLASASGGPSASGTTEAVAAVETGRHPALPRESWVVLFSAHWRAYRAHIAARWPGEIRPYPPEYPPIPAAGDAPRWLAYINGVPMRVKRPEPAHGNDGEDDMDMDDSDEGEGEGRDAAAAAAEEEEAMNAPPAPVDPEEAAMNDAATMYPPREPLVGVLQRMDTNTIVRVLKHLTRFTRTAIERLRDEEEEGDGEGDPLPPAHARWAFALLAVLEEHLGGDDVSVLREFARVAADVALYRWETAIARGQVTPVLVKEGFYGQGSDQAADKEAMLGEQGGKEPSAPQGYLVGARWKAVRDSRARSDATPRPESAEAGHDPAGLDETLARAWTCAHAVVAGWAQWDLVDDFERLFVGVPRVTVTR